MFRSSSPFARRLRGRLVGDDFGEDGLFERAAVGVAEVFEQVLKVNARLAHAGILSREAMNYSSAGRGSSAVRRRSMSLFAADCVSMN